mmetsp:Transcript_18104/g.50864  ORF Transcript_18104/g.50864 Transcript_18104/m.50864 type:complete len:222 (-) Transcript_18104:25-690(-)
MQYRASKPVVRYTQPSQLPGDSMPGHGKRARKVFHLCAHGCQLVRELLVSERLEKVGELLARLALHLECELNTTVDEFPHLDEISLLQATCRHRWRADSDAAGCHRRDIAVHRIFVERDVHILKHLLHLVAGEAKRTQVDSEVYSRLVLVERRALLGRLGPRRKKIMPARGPRRDLCVVVVTMSAYSNGQFCSPVATSPEMCAISTRRKAPTLSQMERIRA